MSIRLSFRRETSLARLYVFKDGTELWIPHNIIKSTVKFPAKDPLEMDVHDLTIEDWWWEKTQEDISDEQDEEFWNRNLEGM